MGAFYLGLALFDCLWLFVLIILTIRNRDMPSGATRKLPRTAKRRLFTMSSKDTVQHSRGSGTAQHSQGTAQHSKGSPGTATATAVLMTGGASCPPSTADGNDFNHPTHVREWFTTHPEAEKHRYNFIYGLGVILKYKEETMQKNIDSILKEIDKNNDEYAQNELNYEKLMGEAASRSVSDMKEKLQETVRENLNKAYETKFSELLVKKQSYDVVKNAIINRRWYLVGELQKTGLLVPGGDAVPGAAIFDKIIKAAEEVYTFYRGPKYTKILADLYNMIKIISDTPSSFQESFALNASIVGPAGSGKTTMARQIAKWYAFLGIMTYDSFFENPDKLSLSETGRTGLIGEYTGQTAPKTLGVMVKSLEKTLFIDEAYSVAGCSFDKDDKLEPDPYGDEFLSTMLTFMNDHKGFSAIIVAGYENFMRKCFFERNEGLPRRFPKAITLPFYATDELFGIFLRVVLMKLLTGAHEAKVFAEKQKKVTAATASATAPVVAVAVATAPVDTYSDIVYKRFRYLTVMKPSFMMIHGDTSFHAIEILRKYLLSIQLRFVLTAAADGSTSVANLNAGVATEAVAAASSFNITHIYSYTVLAQVLINLFQSDAESARKQIFRRLFYEKVYNFSKSNMSYFPAQAGEMDNLADECLRSIGGSIGEDQLVIGVCKESDIINNFCLGKKIRVELYEELGEEKYLELNITNNKMDSLQKSIYEFFELEKLFESGIPSLTQLYDMLLSEVDMKRMSEHMINLYLKKVSADYLEDLNGLSEKEFPIHITKAALETEIEELKYINEFKPTKEMLDKAELPKNRNILDEKVDLLKTLSTDEKFKELMVKAGLKEAEIRAALIAANEAVRSKSGASLANPKYAALTGLEAAAKKIAKSDIMYEDFGYSAKVFRDDDDKVAFVEGTAPAPVTASQEHNIDFLTVLDKRVFSPKTVKYDERVNDKKCVTKELAASETKTVDSYMSILAAARVTLKSPREELWSAEARAKEAAIDAYGGEQAAKAIAPAPE